MIFGKWDERHGARVETRNVTAMNAVSVVTNGDPKNPAPVLAERPLE
jgi:hypothetical protein